jgi:hypothetical protein
MTAFYHYTSLPGFKGILDNRCIWATSTSYLNDASEFRHALNIVRSIIGNMFMENDYEGAFAWIVRECLSKIEEPSVYVASFSAKPDVLSQWRGYCPSGAGLCLGFDGDVVQNFCDQNSFHFKPCIYEHEDQLGAVLHIVSHCLAAFPQHELSREEYEKLPAARQAAYEQQRYEYLSQGDGATVATNAAFALRNLILDLAPLFKHPGFHEELEWRIIARQPQVPIKFRANASYLAPYIELPLLGDGLSSLREVIIGPNPNQSRCALSVEMALKSYGFDNVEVKTSTLPFVSW